MHCCGTLCCIVKYCKYCEIFEDTLWSSVKKIKNINFKKINGPKNPILTAKYGIKTYPSLVVIKDGEYKLFNGERNMTNIKNFLHG